MAIADRTMYVDGQVYQAGEGMFCPSCREPLKETDIVAAVLWD